MVVERLRPLKKWIQLDHIVDCTKDKVPQPALDEFGRGLHTFIKLDAPTIRNMLFSPNQPRAIIWDTSPSAILMVQRNGVIWAIFSDNARACTRRFKNAEFARRFVANKSKGVSVVSVSVVRAA